MNNLLVYPFLFVIPFLFGFSHTSAQEWDSTSVADFNLDGSKDTIFNLSDAGSNFGGRIFQFYDGLSGEYHELENFSSFGAFRSQSLIPPFFLLEQNEQVYHQLKKYLFPEFREAPSPSLDWILAAEQNQVTVSEGSSFDLVLNPETEWVEGDFILPENYAVALPNNAGDESGNDTNEARAKGIMDGGRIVSYYGANHCTGRNPAHGNCLAPALENGRDNILKTMHGLIAFRKEGFRWLFISDSEITGAPEKLRWKSIHQVEMYGQHLILAQITAGWVARIWLIDTRTGILGRISGENLPGLQGGKLFHVLADNLILESNGSRTSYAIPELVNELSGLK